MTNNTETQTTHSTTMIYTRSAPSPAGVVTYWLYTNREAWQASDYAAEWKIWPNEQRASMTYQIPFGLFNESPERSTLDDLVTCTRGNTYQ